MIGRLAAMAVVCAGLFTSTAHADDLATILSKAAAGKKAPGAALMTIQDYRVADKAVYGVRKLGDPTAVTPSDVWNIGSDGKAMTAVIVARLVERGVLSWDETLASLLP